MRGTDETSFSLFSDVDLDDRLPSRRPLRKIRQRANDTRISRDGEFAAIHADFGRLTIVPERLNHGRQAIAQHSAARRASLIQILFSIGPARHLVEQMLYHLMFRWVVGLGSDDPIQGMASRN